MRATNAQFEAAEILQRLDVRLLELSPGDKGWDVFSLHYHVDGPISTVRKRGGPSIEWQMLRRGILEATGK